MADQVNPLGNLAPSTLPVSPVPAPAPAPAAPKRDEAKKTETLLDQVTLSIATVVAEGKPAHTPTLEDAAKALREFLKNIPSDLQFRQDQDTGLLFFKVVNPLTHEVIRQVPSEEILAMARKLKELADAGKKPPGLLLDQQG